jgi:hypothetical protein
LFSEVAIFGSLFPQIVRIMHLTTSLGQSTKPAVISWEAPQPTASLPVATISVRVGNDPIGACSTNATHGGRSRRAVRVLPLCGRPNVCASNQCGTLTRWSHGYLRSRFADIYSTRTAVLSRRWLPAPSPRYNADVATGPSVLPWTRRGPKGLCHADAESYRCITQMQPSYVVLLPKHDISR